jgi:3-isopropylmalate dehydrogenase
VALLLEHVGLLDEAARVEKAVLADITARTPGTKRSTSEIGDAVAAAVAAGV